MEIQRIEEVRNIIERETKVLVIFVCFLLSFSLLKCASQSTRLGFVPLDVPSESSVDWWSQFKHDSNNTGCSASQYAPETNHTLWIFDTSSTSSCSSPVVVDRKLYVGIDETLYCLSARTGAIIWQTALDPDQADWWSSPAVAYDRVYVTTLPVGYLRCFSADSGVELWRVPYYWADRSTPAVADNRVYFSYNNNTLAINAITGAVIWNETIAGSRFTVSDVAVANGKVYVGDDNGHIACLDAATGGMSWSTLIPSSTFHNHIPTVFDNRVLMLADDGMLYCLDASTGSHDWNYDTNSWDPDGCGPTVAEGKVYVANGDGRMFCLEADDGDFLWSCDLDIDPYRFYSYPAVADGKVYVGTTRGIFCYDAENGNMIWSYKPAHVVGSAAIANGIVYFGCDAWGVGGLDCKVLAFALPNLEPVIAVPYPIDDPRARIHLGFISADYNDPTPRAGMMTFDGVNWETMPAPLPNPPTAPFAPSLAINPEPYVYAPVFTMITTINPEPYLNQPNIALRQYDGTEWAGPSSVPTTPYSLSPTGVHLRTSNTSNLFLFWQYTNSTPNLIVQSVFDGSSWSTPTELGAGQQPTATLYNDDIYVLWTRDGNLVYRVFDSTNSSWSEERGLMLPFLINPQPTPFNPLITVHDDLLYVAYESASLGQIYLHTFNGSSWSSAYALENGAELAPSHPALASYQGSLHIVYSSERSLYHQILVGDLDTGEWSVPREIPALADWWPMFKHDSEHTGQSSSSTPSTCNVIWNFTTSAELTASPSIADGRVYIVSNDGKIYCLNAYTGTHLWNFTFGGTSWSSPVISGGKVYFGIDAYKIYCLNAYTGALIWNYTSGGAIRSSPTVVLNNVYFGSLDYRIYCLDASNGEHVWNHTTGDQIYSSPVVSNGRVFIGSDDNKTYCLDALTGAFLWNYTTNGFCRSSPLMVYGNVYFGSGDHKIYCLNASTGVHIWDYLTDNRIFYSSPSVGNGRIYVGSEDCRIYCLDAFTGLHIWNYSTYNQVWSSPLYASDGICVGSKDRRVYFLNASDGQVLWSYLTDGTILSSPAIANGIIFVASSDHKIYAFGSPKIHDVAVTRITPSKTICSPSCLIAVNVTVANQGNFTESCSLTLVAYNVVEMRQVNVGIGESTTETFIWDTSGMEYGACPLNASISPIPDENDTEDNSLSYDSVFITILGDVNGDRKVDITDITMTIASFGRTSNSAGWLSPTWYANCDVNDDNIVDITDIVIVIGEYGNSW